MRARGAGRVAVSSSGIQSPFARTFIALTWTQANANRFGMACETFCLGEQRRFGSELGNALGGVTLHGDQFYESVDAQPAARASDSEGWQRVIGAGDVVTHRLRCPLPGADGAGVLKPFEVGFRLDGEMFGSEAVRHLP